MVLPVRRGPSSASPLAKACDAGFFLLATYKSSNMNVVSGLVVAPFAASKTVIELLLANHQRPRFSRSRALSLFLAVLLSTSQW